MFSGLTSPVVLCFALGFLATVLKSDLKLPDSMYAGLSVYLLLAIGMKGGMKLSKTAPGDFIFPALAALSLCVLIPVWSFFICRWKLDTANAAAMAAHYGSVSAVTFSQSLSVLDFAGVSYEGFMPSMLAIMEIPAIIIGILMFRLASSKQGHDSERTSTRAILHELLTGRSSLLLMGGLLIGFVSGEKGFQKIAPLFDAPFAGVLALFLLELGLVTGRRIGDVRQAGFFIVAFAIFMPVLHGILGVLAGHWAGLSEGGAAIMGVLASSASYIAAPAAIRISIPQSSPSIYLTASLAITFPFNILIGINIYHAFSRFISG